MKELNPAFWPVLIGAIILVTIQGTWIFLDARKRGENYWLWGLFGLMNTPGNLIVYLIVTRSKKVTCPDCGKLFRAVNDACPHCGGATHACTRCGTEARVDWDYCPRCAQKLR